LHLKELKNRIKKTEESKSEVNDMHKEIAERDKYIERLQLEYRKFKENFSKNIDNMKKLQSQIEDQRKEVAKQHYNEFTNTVHNDAQHSMLKSLSSEAQGRLSQLEEKLAKLVEIIHGMIYNPMPIISVRGGNIGGDPGSSIFSKYLIPLLLAGIVLMLILILRWIAADRKYEMPQYNNEPTNVVY